VPIAGVKAGKGPGDVGPREPGYHMGVFEHVLAIIVNNKTITGDGPIDHECKNTEQRANQKSETLIVLKLTQGWICCLRTNPRATSAMPVRNCAGLPTPAYFEAVFEKEG
jgi:hypothetical protein